MLKSVVDKEILDKIVKQIIDLQKPDVDSNTWLGINSTEDNQLQLMRLQNNSELFFVKGLFKMDTQIGFPDQFVLYTTLT